ATERGELDVPDRVDHRETPLDRRAIPAAEDVEEAIGARRRRSGVARAEERDGVTDAVRNGGEPRSGRGARRGTRGPAGGIASHAAGPTAHHAEPRRAARQCDEVTRPGRRIDAEDLFTVARGDVEPSVLAERDRGDGIREEGDGAQDLLL